MTCFIDAIGSYKNDVVGVASLVRNFSREHRFTVSKFCVLFHSLAFKGDMIALLGLYRAGAQTTRAMLTVTKLCFGQRHVVFTS